MINISLDRSIGQERYHECDHYHNEDEHNWMRFDSAHKSCEEIRRFLRLT